MDEKNFDNKLKDILGNPPLFDMPPGDLEDMKKRLEENQPSSRGFVWWWVPLLLLPFLLSGLFLFNKYQSLNQQVKHLSLQLSKIQQDSLQTHQLITYQYDTIYTTIYKDVIIERRFEESSSDADQTASSSQPYYSSSLLNLPALQQRYFNVQSIAWDLGQTGPFLLNSDPNSSFYSSPRRSGSFLGLTKTPPGLSDPRNTSDPNNLALMTAFARLSSLKTPLLSPTDRQLSEELLEDVLPLSTERSVNPAYYLVPTGLSLEARYLPFTLSNIPDAQQINAFGIAAEVKFPGPLRLQVGAELLQVNFESKDDSNPNNYPIIPPNNPGDPLEEIKGTFRYLQLPIGLKMIFRQTKKYRPFLSAGIVARRPFRQSFSYEYLSVIQGEYKIANTINDGAFSINNIRTGLGLEYPFLKKWAANTTLYYQHSFDLSTGDYFHLRYWGLNLGLRYQL